MAWSVYHEAKHKMHLHSQIIYIYNTSFNYLRITVTPFRIINLYITI